MEKAGCIFGISTFKLVRGIGILSTGSLLLDDGLLYQLFEWRSRTVFKLFLAASD
jgi:hypothetical protein